MKALSTDLLSESITSNLFPIKLFDDKVFRYSSQRAILVAIALALIFHIFLALILSSFIKKPNNRFHIVSETSSALTLTLSLKNTKSIIPYSINNEFNENKSTTKKLATNKATSNNNIENILDRKRDNQPNPTSESISVEKERPFILQDLLDNVAIYMENEKDIPSSLSGDSIIMDKKLRENILEESNDDRYSAKVKSQQAFYQNNKYFEFKSAGTFSTVRINGKCFMIPADVPFSNEPKIWMHLGDCEKKKQLNFNPSVRR